MEIEKKYHLPDSAHLDRVAHLRTLGGYTLRPVEHVEQQRNTYYDTPDGLLESQRYGLRIREIDGRRIVTMKGPGTGQAGLHRRQEWELEADDPHPATWPPGEARQHALALLADRPLIALLTITTRRRHLFGVRDNQDIAELSLDESQIEAGGQREAFCELEIELLPAGSEADLDALETALQEHLPLVPENRSKLERGLRLRKQNTSKEK